VSTLFETSSGIVPDHVTIPRNLEMRRIPHLRQTQMSLTPALWRDGIGSEDAFNQPDPNMLRAAYLELETNWMYTAMIQASLNGPEPSWSKDGWSFVPFDVTQIKSSLITKKGGSSKLPWQPEANLTVSTPAIRGNIACSMIEETKNTSLWLSDNKRPNIPPLVHYEGNETYILDPGISTLLNITGQDEYFIPTLTMFGGNVTTRFTAQGKFPKCCANVSDAADSNHEHNPVVFGYWTENWERTKPSASRENRVEKTTGNFTIKWVRGPASFGSVFESSVTESGSGNLYFPEVPAIQALNCMPQIEIAEAEISVDHTNGAIQAYRILDEPFPATAAWPDAFVYRNLSARPFFPGEGYINCEMNHTTRLVASISVLASLMY
jgi:hypothetical protein